MYKKLVELWLGLCDRDLKGAHGMFETKNYVLAGFQCQQVVEKALKAYIASVASEGEDPPRIHNLLRLAEWKGLKAELSAEQWKLVNDLNPLYIEARYADYKSAILSMMTPEHCKNLTSQTEEFLLWIKKRLLN